MSPLAAFLSGVAVAVVAFLIKEVLEYLWRRARIRRVVAADLMQLVDSHVADVAILEPYLAALSEPISGALTGQRTLRMQWNSPATLRSFLIDNSSCLTSTELIRGLRFYDLCERNAEIRNVYNEAVGAVMKTKPAELGPQAEAGREADASEVGDPLEFLLRLIVACGDDLLGNYREVVVRGSELLLRLDPDAPVKYRQYAEKFASAASRDVA